MIDTVTLRLNEGDFGIMDHNAFSPNTYNFFYPPYSRMGSRGYVEAYNNPTQQDYKKGIYKPQLTLRKRWVKDHHQIYLFIQFSAPKLKYLNNFDEIDETCLEEIIEKLVASLRLMSVVTTKDILRNSLVCKVHFSKNIPLPKYVIPYSVVKEVAKTDLSLRYDLSEKDYKNKGESIRFHTNNFEVILYDKKKDLKKAKTSEKRAIEDENTIQLNLFDSIAKIKNFEVLRIEIRYNNIQKIKSKFNKDFQLKDIFNNRLSLEVVQGVWNEIINNYQLLNCDLDNKTLFLGKLIADNPNVRLGSILSVYGFLEYSKALGIREFRQIIEKRFSKRAWYDLKRKINSFEINGNRPEYFDYITNYLQSYEPLRLNEYVDF